MIKSQERKKASRKKKEFLSFSHLIGSLLDHLSFPPLINFLGDERGIFRQKKFFLLSSQYRLSERKVLRMQISEGCEKVFGERLHCESNSNGHYYILC